MITKVRRFLLYKVCAVISLLVFSSLASSTSALAESVEPPANVSALVHSSTAIELFWTPARSVESGLPHRVQVRQNGELLGLLDARSLFRSGLQPGMQLNYELRSVAPDGQVSSAVMVNLSTADFTVPGERVYGAGQGDESVAPTPSESQTPIVVQNGGDSGQSIAPPTHVRSLIYSSTAAELFWTPARDGDSGVAYRVEVKRNGESLGQLDASSLFQSDLPPDTTLNYELRSVAPGGQRSSAVALSVNTAGGNSSGTPSNEPVPSNDAPAPVPPVVAPEPETQTPVATPDTQVPVATPDPVDIVQGNDNCIARDVSGLLSCVRDANAYSRIDIAQDITCDGNCCPNGLAMLRLDNVNDLHIAGNGKRLLRKSSQRQCSLLDVNGSTGLRISNLSLDDDANVGGCQVTDKCPRMVHIKRSSNISFNNTHISNGKGYAFYVQGTNGFEFRNGSLHNSGVLGMYIGHGDDASSNISITDSVFSDNQTNGLALLGVKGSSISSNLVANNLFVRNHRRGQWAVLPQYGTGFTGGGQFYIAQATNVTVRNNVVRDGYCDNCFVQRRNRSGVSGIELGLPNRASVSNVVLSDNRVLNNDAVGISQNSNSTLKNVQIRNNALLNNTTGEHVSGAVKTGNRVQDTQHFDSFENGNDLGGRFDSSVSCSAGGSVTRRCGGDSRFGQCAVQLELANADCNNANAELVGPAVAIRAGQLAVGSGWVQNPAGRWCLIFRDASGNKSGEQCRNLSDADNSTVQPFVGLPLIETRAPARSASVQMQIVNQQPGNRMLVDDLKLSVAN